METSRLTVKNIFLNSCLSPQNWQEFVLKSCLKQSFVIKKKTVWRCPDFPSKVLFLGRLKQIRKASQGFIKNSCFCLKNI